MDENKNKNEEIEKLKRYISAAEESLEQARKALLEVTGEGGFTPSLKPLAEGRVIETGKIIEGTFDGENMIGPEGKKYPVPANYSSKSKLVEGDRLKLTVADDGSFIFKQIGPIERKKLVGTLTFEDNVYHVLAEGKSYKLLYASVTYHKAKPGDRVTIVVPSGADSLWAALENVIHDTPAPAPEPEEVFDLPEAKQEPVQLPVDEPVAVPPVQAPNEPVLMPEEPVIQPAPTENSLPQESFLPRTPQENTNNLGEVQPNQTTNINATELDI